jgi:hypothetical protein
MREEANMQNCESIWGFVPQGNRMLPIEVKNNYFYKML